MIKYIGQFFISKNLIDIFFSSVTSWTFNAKVRLNAPLYITHPLGYASGQKENV